MTIAALKALCSRIPWCEPPVLESVVELALEIARGGCAYVSVCLHRPGVRAPGISAAQGITG